MKVSASKFKTARTTMQGSPKLALLHSKQNVYMEKITCCLKAKERLRAIIEVILGQRSEQQQQQQQKALPKR